MLYELCYRSGGECYLRIRGNGFCPLVRLSVYLRIFLVNFLPGSELKAYTATLSLPLCSQLLGKGRAGWGGKKKWKIDHS